MRYDIRKLSLWLEQVCQEGVALEHKILEWKMAEAQKPATIQQRKAS